MHFVSSVKTQLVVHCMTNTQNLTAKKYFYFDLDFDGDDMLGFSDLNQVIERLIGDQNRLPENYMKFLIQVKRMKFKGGCCANFPFIFLQQIILSEADLNDDGALSFPEFEHIIDKWSDFTK